MPRGQTRACTHIPRARTCFIAQYSRTAAFPSLLFCRKPKSKTFFYKELLVRTITTLIQSPHAQNQTHSRVVLYCCLLGRPFLCIVSFRCFVFCLLFVLVKLSVLAMWLARKTLRKPNRGEAIVSRKPRPKSAHDFLGLCIPSLFYYVFVLSPPPTWHIFLLLWRDIAYLCWKCR